jgi:two-component system response regulator BasR
MRILIVEDDRYLAHRIQEKFQNFICDLEFTPDDGLFTARTQHYDLAIIDLCFDCGSGLTLIKQARKDQLQFPILIVSSCCDCHDIVQGLDFGADDYLTKPFSWTELKARARALLRRPQQYSNNVIKSGPLTLNLNSWQISYYQQPLQLIRKHKLILACLLRNANRIVTRPILISQVWQKQYVPRSTIDSQISLLRKAVKQQIGLNIIKTVHGFGYQLKSNLS